MKIIQEFTRGGQSSSNKYFIDELAGCNFVKIILMFLVVLYHSCLFWGNAHWFVGEPEYNAPFIDIISAWLNSFHIYCFTLISGYIFYYLKYEKGCYQVFKDFLENKFRRLIIPYIFIATVWVVPVSLFFYDWTLSDLFKKFILCSSPSQLWFLWMLFDVFIIGWMLSDKLQNDKFALIIALSSFVISVIGSKMMFNVFCIWTTARFFPLFIVGMKLRSKKEWILRRIPLIAYIIADLLLFVGWKWSSSVDNDVIYKFYSVVMGLGLNIVGPLMVFFVLQEISCRIDWESSKIISYLGKRTMVVYLLHQQIIYFTINYFDGLVNPYINIWINFVASIFVSIILANVLISNKWTRFLVGEKKVK